MSSTDEKTKSQATLLLFVSPVSFISLATSLNNIPVQEVFLCYFFISNNTTVAESILHWSQAETLMKLRDPNVTLN